MKISLNWLKKLVDVKISDEELIRLIGARLVEVEGVIDETHKYDNIYVVRVVSAEKIPETHLTLCKIDVGNVEILRVEKDEDGLVQVICGAPNVHAGMLAAWIAPGAIVPASVHEDAPFVIGKRRMLGKYDSNGMLAGADELDFGDDHSGIVEISEFELSEQAGYFDDLRGEHNIYNMPPVVPGQKLAEVFDLEDKILEIENKSLTHRPDCFGLVGFAREVAGILGQKFECDYAKESLEIDNGIEIDIEDATICPRYSAMVLNRKSGSEKKFLTYTDIILCKSGMKPIDKIVDATNLIMLNTGQPLHAFDYDKFIKVGGIEDPLIRVRLAKTGEKLVLLDGKEIELNENDIVICSNNTPVALAGAMGGESTKIDETTKRIILESATFSLYNLRKTQMAHGIFSEAITRFTKGQPTYQTLGNAKKFADMLREDFSVVNVSDCYKSKEKENVVKITTSEINRLLGTEYGEDLIRRTLENVGFIIKEIGENWEVVAPEWRTDIHIKEDVIEEIGRLLGYDSIEPVLPAHFTAEKNKMFEFKHEIRDILAKFGANEILTYSFVSGDLLSRVGQEVKNSYKITNSISPVLQYVRQSIVPSLLEKTYMNEKLPVEKFAIFEMNTVYRKDLGLDAENVPVEKKSLGMVVAERKNSETAFYKAKKYVNGLLESFNIQVEFLPVKNKFAEIQPFERERSAEIWVNDVYVGVVGEFKNIVKHDFKLAPYLAGFEIDLEVILPLASQKRQIKFSKKTIEDLTITTDKKYAEVLKDVKEKYPNAEILPGVIYQAEGADIKNITFHIVSQE